MYAYKTTNSGSCNSELNFEKWDVAVHTNVDVCFEKNDFPELWTNNKWLQFHNLSQVAIVSEV